MSQGADYHQDAILNRLLSDAQSLYPTEIELSLDRMERLLRDLGDPHLSIPPVIHIAGTNGKGSTLAILQSLLEHSGYSVHKMTSPHLIHITERFIIAGQQSTPQQLINGLTHILHINNGKDITYFELLTALGFYLFAQSKADFTLLETGMGGKYDASNVIPHPICTIITAISKDHCEFLGNDIMQIAEEKAGIIKKDFPCIIGRQESSLINQKLMHNQSSPFFICNKEWAVKQDNDRIVFQWDQEEVFPSPNLIGAHQIDNAGNALAAYFLLAQSNYIQPACRASIKNALQNIQWHGRMQPLNIGSHQDIWLDGGHNPAAGQAIAKQAQQWEISEPRPLYLILGMMSRKDITGFIKPIQPYLNGVIVTSVMDEPDALNQYNLSQKLKDLGIPIIDQTDNPIHYCQNNNLPKNARILITGSLYLAGQILSQIKP